MERTHLNAMAPRIRAEPARKTQSGPMRSVLTPETVMRLQRSAGNRAVSALMSRQQPPKLKPITVQRAVGFEFETAGPHWYVGVPKKTLTQPQMDDADLDPKTVLKKKSIEKGDPLASGEHFELQGDEDNDPKKPCHIEFVTDLPPFPETDQGRADLQNSLADMQRMMNYLAANRDKGFIPASALGGTVETAGSGIMPKRATEMKLSPQATAGIGLNKVGSFFEEIGRTNAGDVRHANQDLMGLQGDEDKVGKAPAKARTAVANLRRQPTTPRLVGSDELVGLVSICVTYIYRSRGDFRYIKLIAPIMARTDMATIFSKLKFGEKEWFEQDPIRFRDLVLDATGANYSGQAIGPDVDMFPRGMRARDNTGQLVTDTSITGKLTIGEWLEGIAAGVDKLTKMNWPHKKTRNQLESMGNLKDKVEEVGTGTASLQQAPIFELRRMKQELTIDQSMRMALDTFDYIRRLNSGQANPHYTRT